MKENRTIVGIGEVLWDILPDGKKIGGAPANFAYHVSQFGLQSLVVSAIGDNALGQEIIGTFQDKGLNSLISTVPYRNSTSRTRHGRHPTIYHKGGRRMGLHSIHAGTGSIGPQHLRSMFRFTCTEEHGIPQHHQSLH